MIERRMTLQFVTPAFLGGADQKGHWRTPPIKALLRQWWRVASARRSEYDHRRLREEEGRIFGHAWLKDETGRAWAARSHVLLRLQSWTQGRLEKWPGDSSVFHPEVGQGGRSVGAHLYLGYGPLTFERGTKLKAPPAIDTGDSAILVLAYPDALHDALADTLQLVAWFGTIGGRSRNGWGSLELTGDGLTDVSGLGRGESLVAKVTRPLDDCLRLDWPHALGHDDRGLLVWKTVTKKSWADAMRNLAEIKIAYRTTPFPFDGNAARPLFQDRQLLAYPVTNHPVPGWRTERLANQLRFKVMRNPHGYAGIIAHLPCALPDQLARALPTPARPSTDRQLEVWRKVHAVLDGRRDLQRVSESAHE